MVYVDGFVFPVKKKKIKEYINMASKAGKVWMKHGALDYKECMGDDLNVKQMLSFPKMTKSKSDEIVFFSYIVFKSKKHRDQVNAKVMKDPLMDDPKYKDMPMPFDMKKMAYGGFKPVADMK